MHTRAGAIRRKKQDTVRNQNKESTSTDSEEINVEDVDSEHEIEPPSKFFFNHNCYKTKPKLSSRYSKENVPKVLKKVLTKEELDWFIYHPQFKHIWHMYREDHRKFNPMWLLLLRTVFIDEEKVCWFVVNGVPIRYSIREHGLLCGLNCSSYPPNHPDLGSNKFFIRNFGDVEKNTVMIKDVKEKLSSDCFEVNEDRLKMAVLFFLSIIIKPRKMEGIIDEFFFRIVDDLSACERYPWGRYTFIDTINNISRLTQNFKGHEWRFPGFIYPLEIMACECIPELRRWYREDVAEAEADCPRICKSKWKRNKMTFKAVNKTLGDTKEIHSILDPRLEEKCLVNEIFEGEEEELYSINPVARSWEKSLIENKKIFWEELYQRDITSRSPNAPRLQQRRQQRPPSLNLHDVQDQMETSLRTSETKIMTRLSNLDTKVSNLETKVSKLETENKTSRERNASEFNGFSENGCEHAAYSFGGGGDENAKESEHEAWGDTSVTELLASDEVLASNELWADTSITDRITSDLSPHTAASETLAPTAESSEVENLKENLNRYEEERPVEVEEPLHSHHDYAATEPSATLPPQSLSLSKKEGFFGVVALLGSVACMSLNRVLSRYLGKDKMLSLVCISSQSGLTKDDYRKLQSEEAAKLGLSITTALKTLDKRIVKNDPQKRLAMDRPYLPNGEPIPGFKGYAVNMIDIASEDLLIQSTLGHGLRETLYYSVLGELHVYDTLEHLEEARPHINGKDAVSLDGVISTTYGFIFPGPCAPDVHFPVTVTEKRQW